MNISNIFSKNSYSPLNKIYNNLAVIMCLTVLGQAYLPHGDGMKNYVDDMMDQLEEMFRSSKKDEDDEDDNNLILTSLLDTNFVHNNIIKVGSNYYKIG